MEKHRFQWKIYTTKNVVCIVDSNGKNEDSNGNQSKKFHWNQLISIGINNFSNGINKKFHWNQHFPMESTFSNGINLFPLKSIGFHWNQRVLLIRMET